MAIEFQTTRVHFDPTRGQTQRGNASANFSRSVKSAGVAMNGFQMKYSDFDHHVWEQAINIEETNMRIHGNNVSVPVSFLLRDSSGNIDDPYEGWVDVLVVAEV